MASRNALAGSAVIRHIVEVADVLKELGIWLSSISLCPNELEASTDSHFIRFQSLLVYYVLFGVDDHPHWRLIYFCWLFVILTVCRKKIRLV